jgi:hypothetical protein
MIFLPAISGANARTVGRSRLIFTQGGISSPEAGLGGNWMNCWRCRRDIHDNRHVQVIEKVTETHRFDKLISEYFVQSRPSAMLSHILFVVA